MKTLLIRLIRLYQKYVSPLKRPCCRFYPTCSSYAIEAIEKKGVIRGGFMSVWRVLRCNPFGQGGFDPVEKTDTNITGKIEGGKS